METFNPTYIDIHSHLNDPQFDQDRDAIAVELQERGISSITVGVDEPTSALAIKLATAYEHLYATVGIHPNDNKNEIYDEAVYQAFVSHPKVVAIGECGFDFYRMDHVNDEEYKRQEKLFRAQIELAIHAKLPLMVHTRSAHQETLALLRSYKKEYGDMLKGNIHFFTAGYDIAKQYFDLDFTISFPGVVTFSREYDDAVIDSPLERIMAETDSPYAAPVPHRGKRNTPLYIGEIYQMIATLRGEDIELVRTQLIKNAERVFLQGKI